MTAFKDVELIAARDPETGEVVECVRIPDDYVLCLVSKETAEKHADWQECVAVRIVTSEDGTVGALEVCDDEEWLTSPEGPQ